MADSGFPKIVLDNVERLDSNLNRHWTVAIDYLCILNETAIPIILSNSDYVNLKFILIWKSFTFCKKIAGFGKSISDSAQTGPKFGLKWAVKSEPMCFN